MKLKDLLNEVNRPDRFSNLLTKSELRTRIQQINDMNDSVVKSTIERVSAWKQTGASIGLRAGFHDNPKKMDTPVKPAQMKRAETVKVSKVPGGFWIDGTPFMKANELGLSSTQNVYTVTFNWPTTVGKGGVSNKPGEKLISQITKAFEKLGFEVRKPDIMPQNIHGFDHKRKNTDLVNTYAYATLLIHPTDFGSTRDAFTSAHQRSSYKNYVKKNT